jgi:hypothetical protein
MEELFPTPKKIFEQVQKKKLIDEESELKRIEMAWFIENLKKNVNTALGIPLKYLCSDNVNLNENPE